MCDDWFHEYPEYEEETHIDSPPSQPRRISYRQADAPHHIAERLAYFKYHKKFQKFLRELIGLVTPPLDLTVKAKQRFLCLHVRGEYYTFMPVRVDYEHPSTQVEYMGVYVNYASAPLIKLKTYLHYEDERVKIRKYQTLIHTAVSRDGLVPITICGMPFYIEDAHFSLDPQQVEVTFVAANSATYGRHSILRDKESDRKKHFAHYVNTKERT